MLTIYALLAFTSLFVCTGFMYLAIRQYAVQTVTFLHHLAELEKRLNPESNDKVVRVEELAKQSGRGEVGPALPFPHEAPKSKTDILEDLRNSAEEMSMYVD